jgi:hypothetical protein
MCHSFEKEREMKTITMSKPISGMCLVTLMLTLGASLANASAGNVTVQWRSGEWKITGDSSHNAVVLTSLSTGNIRVSGAASDGGTTTINRGAYADITAPKKVSISLNEGNDRLVFQGNLINRVRFTSLTLSLGRGIDTVNANSIYVANTLTINMGSESGGGGYENAILGQSDVGRISYSTDRTVGANFFNITGVDVRGDISIRGSNAHNSVSLASVMVQGSVTGQMGSEPNNSTITDTFAISSCTIRNQISLEMREGRSQTSFHSVSADNINVRCGGSLDQILISGSRVRRSRFDGGGGNSDRIAGQGNVFTERPTIIRIERNELR